MKFCIVLAVLLIIIIARAMYENAHFVCEYTELKNKNVKNPFKFVFFADLHNSSYGKNNCKLLNEIDNYNPDFILIAGDVFVAHKNSYCKKSVEFLNELLKKYKVIFTFGNHETKLKNEEKYKYTIKQYIEVLKNTENLIILNNDQINLEISGNIINFIGYEADLKFYKKFKNNIMDVEEIRSKVGEKNNDGDLSFLLAHNPDFFEKYVEYGAEYVFSGHNHGGIVRLPFLGGVVSTGYRPFPKYYGGVYIKNNTTMYVTRGLGSHTIRFRLFNKPQIHMISVSKMG